MPPKAYPSFPSKEERDRLMEQLRQAKASGDALTVGEHYNKFVQSLQKLNEMMDRCYAPDEDGKDNEELYAHVSDKPFDAKTNLNRDIADIQVLDYICGNIDRHGGNLFYDVDPKTGKIMGVQGAR